MKINSGLWLDRLKVNADTAIFHQWEELEASGCIDNFRILAGEVSGFRRGWFFADSDAYKWLEAASLIWGANQDPRLGALIQSFIRLLARAQDADGYLFTYNQIHFPGKRWLNLQIEHELYCHGHLIEAGVSHYEATGREELLEIACRAAGRIAADFHGQGGEHTPGHEEIEIALLRLYQATQQADYLELARQFIEQRSRTPRFAASILKQFLSTSLRSRRVREQEEAYRQAHPGYRLPPLPPGNPARKPLFTPLRWYASVLSGKYFQQHLPIRQQTEPVGHAVRFAYLEAAAARLARLNGDRSLLPALEQAWEHMVTRRMYATGGIGSLPGLEGFGRDYELDPEFAYAETCAALASMFWNWEMVHLTGEARYSDLFEWQLYNAALAGMGLDGTSYLYNNPLASRGGLARQSWYAVPCCPSNLSRTLARLGDYLTSTGEGRLLVHQYISSQGTEILIPDSEGGQIEIGLDLETSLPWEGQTRITLTGVSASPAFQPAKFEIRLRQPAWAGRARVKINAEPVLTSVLESGRYEGTASGCDPRPAVFLSLKHPWTAGCVIDISFDMPVRLLQAHPNVKRQRGRAAVARGPLVYCLEDVDNPGVDLFQARLDPKSLAPIFDPNLLGGTIKIQAKTTEGCPLTFIPYFLWGNRGSSRMNVWVNVWRQFAD